MKKIKHKKSSYILVALFTLSFLLCACSVGPREKKVEEIDKTIWLLAFLKDKTQDALSRGYEFIGSHSDSYEAAEALVFIADTYMYKHKDYYKAIIEYKQILDNYSDYPKSDTVKLKLAEAYERRGNCSQAAIEYLGIIQCSTNERCQRRALEKLGALFFGCDMNEEALNLFKLLYDTHPPKEGLLLMMGLCNEYLHRRDLAGKYYARAAQVYGRDSFVGKRMVRLRSKE